MLKIRVEHIIDKPVDDVFNAISDHENYKVFPAFNESKLIEVGATEKNGLGALRQLSSGRVTFRERITGFERPNKMNYNVEALSPAVPMRQEKGEITLTSFNGKTKVIWISEAHIDVPILGFLLEKIFQRRVGAAFLGILKHIDGH